MSIKYWPQNVRCDVDIFLRTLILFITHWSPVFSSSLTICGLQEEMSFFLNRKINTSDSLCFNSQWMILSRDSAYGLVFEMLDMLNLRSLLRSGWLPNGKKTFSLIFLSKYYHAFFHSIEWMYLFLYLSGLCLCFFHDRGLFFFVFVTILCGWNC